MTNSELYNTIFKRKSIRKYDMTSLPQDRLAEIKEFAGNAKPLDGSINYQFAYLGTNDVKNLLPIKAPHYICLYSEKKDGYLMNAGYLLQQVDLFLSANNIGSCWLGMAKPNKDVPAQKNGLEYVIMLAFGNAAEELHRSSTSEFKRKSLSEITTITGADELLEPVRLAPSASNTQTWFFSGDLNEITVNRVKLNLIKNSIYGKMNHMDSGIALYHLWLSLDHLGKTATYDFNKSDTISGNEFMVKVKVV
ncbi:MAG TPA: nitroreductase family protein [Ruminiclostridium sp.]